MDSEYPSTYQKSIQNELSQNGIVMDIDNVSDDIVDKSTGVNVGNKNVSLGDCHEIVLNEDKEYNIRTTAWMGNYDEKSKKLILNKEMADKLGYPSIDVDENDYLKVLAMITRRKFQNIVSFKAASKIFISLDEIDRNTGEVYVSDGNGGLCAVNTIQSAFHDSNITIRKNQKVAFESYSYTVNSSIYYSLTNPKMALENGNLNVVSCKNKYSAGEMRNKNIIFEIRDDKTVKVNSYSPKELERFNILDTFYQIEYTVKTDKNKKLERDKKIELDSLKCDTDKEKPQQQYVDGEMKPDWDGWTRVNLLMAVVEQRDY